MLSTFLQFPLQKALQTIVKFPTNVAYYVHVIRKWHTAINKTQIIKVTDMENVAPLLINIKEQE